VELLNDDSARRSEEKQSAVESHVDQLQQVVRNLVLRIARLEGRRTLSLSSPYVGDRH
jgi:hypothetical protein